MYAIVVVAGGDSVALDSFFTLWLHFSMDPYFFFVKGGSVWFSVEIRVKCRIET